jgi:16S rRNA (guanine527-N7)-methyltransferase
MDSAMRPDPGPHASLDHQLAALAPQLGLALGDTDRARLLAYMALIERWTKVYNLTAVRDPAEMFTHHLLDCLAVVRPLETGTDHLPTPLHVLDVGSGAGLPGVVLAILKPEWQVTCVDAVAKKATFIRQAAAELGLSNVRAAHGRVESPATFGGQRFGLITSRAFASLADFTQLTRPLLTPTGVWAAMKANLSDQERQELPSDVSMFHVEQIQVPLLDAKRCLVWLRPADRDSETPLQPRQ